MTKRVVSKTSAVFVVSAALLLSACGGSESASDDASDTSSATSQRDSNASASNASSNAQTASAAANDAEDEVEEAIDETSNKVANVTDEAADKASDAMGNAKAAVNSAAADGKAAVETAVADGKAAVENAVADASDKVKATAASLQSGGDAAAGGTTHEIKMYTVNPDDPRKRMWFEPRVLLAQPGDTVTFVPTDPTHQSSSTDGMLPEGEAGWEGEINKPVSYTVGKPGIYGYNCVPHIAAGMVGVIIVEGEGKLANLEAAKAESAKQPGLARRAWPEIWKEAEDAGYL
ncbi:MAG: plastocyanin/azurin family copper-binding protein [Pseudomonadota bacterium]